jgi:hypothetical protein
VAKEFNAVGMGASVVVAHFFVAVLYDCSVGVNVPFWPPAAYRIPFIAAAVCFRSRTQYFVGQQRTTDEPAPLLKQKPRRLTFSNAKSLRSKKRWTRRRWTPAYSGF